VVDIVILYLVLFVCEVKDYHLKSLTINLASTKKNANNLINKSQN